MTKVIYGTKDLALHFNLTTERIRQLVKAELLTPDYKCGNQYFWKSLPKRRKTP